MSISRDESIGGIEVSDVAARVLSVLLITEPDELEDFRKRLLGKKSKVGLEVLEAALEILATTGKALLSTDEALWSRVLAARDALRKQTEALYSGAIARIRCSFRPRMEWRDTYRRCDRRRI